MLKAVPATQLFRLIHLEYFLPPAQTNALICTVTVILLILTLIRLKNENLQVTNTNDTKLIVSVMFKSLAQFFILGCSWIILFIPTNNNLLYTVFEFISSQQGAFIFLVHCLLNQEVSTQRFDFIQTLIKFKHFVVALLFKLNENVQYTI